MTGCRPDIDAMLFLRHRSLAAVSCRGRAMRWCATIVEFNYNVMWFCGLLWRSCSSWLHRRAPTGSAPATWRCFLFTWICLRQHPRRPVSCPRGRRFTGKSTGDHLALCPISLAFLAEKPVAQFGGCLPVLSVGGLHDSGQASASAAGNLRVSERGMWPLGDDGMRCSCSRSRGRLGPWRGILPMWRSFCSVRSIWDGHYAIDGLASIAVVTAGASCRPPAVARPRGLQPSPRPGRPEAPVPRA